MSDRLEIAMFIPGEPAPQGSKRYVGGGRMIESSKKVGPWRADVRAALLNGQASPRVRFDGPVEVSLQFVLYRPKSTPKRATPPAVKKPDLDKLMRAVLDAVGSAGIWRDDAQVTSARCSKRLAELDETPGCHLQIRSLIAEERKAA